MSGDVKFEGTQEEWDALVQKERISKMNFKHYQRKGLSEMIAVTDYIEQGGSMEKVSISEPDQALSTEASNEFEQGYIARNPKNHEDLWYVAKKYFDDNLEPAEPKTATTETFLERLIKERDELDTKLTKLNSFLSNPTKAVEISGIEQYALLCQQELHMKYYLGVLNERINNLLATID